MEPSFLSVIPPFFVLILGFVTRKVLWSLASGIVVAALLSTKELFSGCSLAAKTLLNNLEIVSIYKNGLWSGWNFLIALFLLSLGVFITLLHHSGVAQAYSHAVRRKLRKKSQAEASSLLLSSGLFIDDYFSSLTVGSVMRSVTDVFRIPRAKLAFLVDSMAAPLAVICPISSWVAAILGFLRESGVSNNMGQSTLIYGSPYVAYLHIVPYILYSFVVIIGSWAIVICGFSFGKMKKHEIIAQEEGDLFGKNEPVLSKTNQKPTADNAHILDFLLLILVLILSVLGGLAYSGGYSLGAKQGLIESFRNSVAAQGLFIAGILSLSFQIIWLRIRGLLRLGDLWQLLIKGIKMMLPSVLVLICAWTLGDLLKNHLYTGHYLASIMTGNVSTHLLPLMFFIGSLVTAASIGSSWGTAAVMFPIAVQLYVSLQGLNEPILLLDAGELFIILGAVLSGSVAGDHISPISDTTIMSAISTGMNHTDHVETQLGYALPFIGITGLGFLLLGVFSPSAWWIVYITMFLGTIVLLALLHALSIFNEKKRSHAYASSKIGEQSMSR